MKKFLRVLVPMILVFALIGCTVWYLFVYDPDFTRDVLLDQARACERDGKHAAAAWFYDLAYRQSDDNAAVAIELAQQYKKSGNYTKAEYTLSRAISDGATAELYIELCKTYVEQDKLLDAVSMLDNISDLNVKVQLDAIRPAAPAVIPEPGFYNQYIDIQFEIPGGTLYVTTNGEYPSTENGAFQGSVTLGKGETVIRSLCIGDNGLVSPLAIYIYTVGGVVEPLSFTDPAFESAIREQLELDSDTVIFSDMLWDIGSFYMPEDVKVYDDLAKLPYLYSLTIVGAKSGELNNISYLTALDELILIDSAPTEAEVNIIASLPALKKLTMENCNLSTIAGLASATQLEYLNLNNNTIRNLTPLSNTLSLKQLLLSQNAITDLSALSGLSKLDTLDVSYNSLSVIDPICSIPRLSYLDISHNKLTSLYGIDQLISLNYLYASHNLLSDISELGNCFSLTELDISDNMITDIQSLYTLNDLQRFNFANNQVSVLPLWDRSAALVSIDGSNNLLFSLEELRGLKDLNNVYMDYNSDIESIEPLVKCPCLILVNVYGTKVADVSELTSQSIIVNYDPTVEE